MTERELQVVFGEEMRALRERAGLSQEELAFRCGRHRTFVSAVERGKNAASLTTIWAIAGVLGVPASELLRAVEARLGERGARPRPG
jgi:transcriptional regulator with XRE-family HTH domain